MADSHQPAGTSPPPQGAKKPYSAPTLTECGSVAKLTMAKGSTAVESSQVIKRSCL